MAKEGAAGKGRLANLTIVLSAASTAIPTLDGALRASAVDLARSYYGVKLLLGFQFPDGAFLGHLRSAEQGATIVTPDRTINRDNVDAVQSELKEGLAIYGTAITQRGYKSISGTYRAKATLSCERIPSMWASLIRVGKDRKSVV